jgi:polyisoprenoid-binding protein YceI
MKRAVPALLALALAAPAAADTWVIDKAHSEAGFKVRHLTAKVRGRFTDFAGTIDVDPAKPETAKVQFTIKAASIDTDNESRDKHLRSADFFDAEKFPEITFVSTKVTRRDDKHFDVAGNLTMRGVTKAVTLPVEFNGSVKDPRGNEKAGFEIKTTLNRKDYGIVWNRALDAGGVLLGEEVDVEVNIEAGRQVVASN